VAGEPVGTSIGDSDGWAAAHEKQVQDGFFEVVSGA